jgi:hypothetical protein
LAVEITEGGGKVTWDQFQDVTAAAAKSKWPRNQFSLFRPYEFSKFNYEQEWDKLRQHIETYKT